MFYSYVMYSKNVYIDNYGLDPVHYYTSPGLAHEASLKIPKVELETTHRL